METLVLNVTLFPTPRSTCQASLAWHSPGSKMGAEHSCLCFIPRGCLHRKPWATAHMMSPSHLMASHLALWGWLWAEGKVPVSW